MVERRPFLDFLSHAVLILGIVIVVFPVYLTFVASTLTAEEVLDAPIGPIARSAAELLISEQRERVGQCADDRGCGWLFLDTSKNRRRRWCDISGCGNRAKQRRHYQRVRKDT